MWLLNFYMYENVWEHGQHTGCIQDKPLQPPPTDSYLLFGPELVKHFLDLHTPVVLHAVERVLGHGGHHRLLNGWQLLQDAGKRWTHMGVLVPTLWRHTWEHEPPPNHTLTLASVWLYPPWAWQKVQGRWRGLVGLIYWQPHRKLQPDRLSHDRAPPQLAAPTAGHHSWRVERNGKRETGSDIINRQTWQMGCFVPGFHCYPQTSLPLEKREDLMTSGAIQE